MNVFYMTCDTLINYLNLNLNYYCLVIYLVSSTDQIYRIAASRLGFKFDRSMTLCKLLDNNAQLLIFIS